MGILLKHASRSITPFTLGWSRTADGAQGIVEADVVAAPGIRWLLVEIDNLIGGFNQGFFDRQEGLVEGCLHWPSGTVMLPDKRHGLAVFQTFR